MPPQHFSVLRCTGSLAFACLLVLLMRWPVLGQAQNLIPNGSFETYRSCPTQNNVIEEATPWYNPSRATPDFYHRCFPGFQFPFLPRTGQGMAHLFFDQGFQEYIAVPLTRPLQANQCYYFQMFVATDVPNKYLPATIGASLTTERIESETKSFLPVVPQILDRQTARPERLVWRQVSGSFRAKGGEQYALVGSFVTEPAFLGFYDLYVDDVSLVPIELELGRDTTLCGRRATVTLDATTPGATEYRWDDGSTAPSRLITRPGLYSVSVTTACKILTDSIKVDYALDFDLGSDTTLCQGQSLLLTVPTAPGATFRWQDGTTGNTLTARAPGQYRVEARQATCVTADSLQVRFILPPALDLGPDQNLCGAETFLIEPVVTEGTFFWQDQSADRNRLVSQSGVFRAGVRNDCATVLDSVRISYGACDCVIYAPTAFSPNDDGLNDTFLAYGCGDITITSLMVMNRWGEVIFQTQAPPFRWDGYYQGNRCDAGVYAWRVNYLLRQNDTQTQSRKQGSLMLLH